MQAGKTKDQGLYNKPSVAAHPGALSASTLPQYNKVILMRHVFGPIDAKRRCSMLNQNRTALS